MAFFGGGAAGATTFFVSTGAQILGVEVPMSNKAPAIPNVHNPWIDSDNFSLIYKSLLKLRLSCSMNEWIVNYSNE